MSPREINQMPFLNLQDYQARNASQEGSAMFLASLMALSSVLSQPRAEAILKFRSSRS